MEKYPAPGEINTAGKKDFKYGYFECRAKVPAGNGYLPSFWMMQQMKIYMDSGQNVVNRHHGSYGTTDQ